MTNDKDEKVNIFIAFMLSGESQAKMQRVANEVKVLFLPNGKDEGFFHCTLLFIGRVDKSYIPFIQEKMKVIAASQSPIPITINDISYFYNSKKDRIKVLFARPSYIPQKLGSLCDKLYNEIGMPLKGKTTPPINRARIHFTITKRLKHKLSREDYEARIGGIKHFSIPLTIDNIGLYYCKDLDHRYYREIFKFDLRH